MNYRENWTLLSKLHKLWVNKEENKNNGISKAIYTPMRNFRLNINNEVVDRLKEIVSSKHLEDKQKVKHLKMILDLDEDSIEAWSGTKDLLVD